MFNKYIQGNFNVQTIGFYPIQLSQFEKSTLFITNSLPFVTICSRNKPLKVLNATGIFDSDFFFHFWDDFRKSFLNFIST